MLAPLNTVLDQKVDFPEAVPHYVVPVSHLYGFYAIISD